MTDELSDFQLAVFKEAFSNYDEDGDGYITKRELGKVLNSLGKHPTQTELSDLMRCADTNDNGTIEMNEFLDVMKQHLQETDFEEDLKMAFRLFDEDDNGFISKSELRKVLSTLNMNYSDEEVEKMVDEADLDGDGSISYNEFVLLITSK